MTKGMISYDDYKLGNPYENEIESQAFSLDYEDMIEIDSMHPGCTITDVRTILQTELEHYIFALKIDLKSKGQSIKVNISGWFVDYTELEIESKIINVTTEKIIY